MKTPVYLCVIFASALWAADGKTTDPKIPEVKGEPTPLHTANYELAQRWSANKVGKLVFDTNVTPHWLESSDRFWFSWETTSGRHFYIVDPLKKTKATVFDNAKMAAMLTEITRTPFDAAHLPITTIKFTKNDTVIEFSVDVDKDAEINGTQTVIGQQEDTGVQTGQPDDDSQADAQVADEPQQGRGGQQGPPPVAAGKKRLYFQYDLATAKLTLPAQFTPEPRKPAWASVSPNEKIVVFARKNNLFMMDAASYGLALKKSDDSNVKETQLTTDGVEGFGYNRRMMDQGQDDGQQNDQAEQRRDKTGRVAPVQIFWSKDSTKFVVVREDERKVADLWVIHTLANPRPTLETYKYAMPGEVNVPLPHMEVFDIASKARKEVKADRFKDETIRPFAAPVTARDREHQRNEQQWISDTSDKLYFYRMSRDMHKVDVCLTDPATGEVKVLIEERMNSYIEPKPLRLLANGAEMLWWSERDGWGHYYLYDGNGTVKNQVTSGEFVTENIESIDEKARTMTFVAEGREPNENPYFTHLYSVKLDGTGLKLMDPGDFSHTASISDDGKYFVDNSSRVNTAPHAELYDHVGGTVMDLETTDISVLMDAGFKMPEPFVTKADDGITDIYGVMYKPFDFNPNKKYPIIAYVYPGPQTESVTQTFTPKQANVALAQLGFIVIEVGNRGGNPHRSKWYHNYGYGNLRDYGLADKKAAIEELARRYPWIDIDRVGITGHSGGGFMSTAAMLVYPDFFKVAVSESGNHENNVYNQTWSEKNHGIKEVDSKDGSVSFQYSIEKNSEIAKNLKGHLLLSTGDMDNNVHMANTMRLADALIKANKRFDMFVLPGQRHSYGPEANYFFWVRADYFCRWLLGDSDQRVDMVELENDKAETGDRPRGNQGNGRGRVNVGGPDKAQKPE